MEEDGTVISDGRHRLPLYRCDAIPPGAAYLNKVGLQRRERLVLSVRLDSTKLTQNGEICFVDTYSLSVYLYAQRTLTTL